MALAKERLQGHSIEKPVRMKYCIVEKTQCKQSLQPIQDNHICFSQLLQLLQICKENGMYVWQVFSLLLLHAGTSSPCMQDLLFFPNYK